MKRRLLAVVAAAALGVAVLPIAPAVAAGESGSAKLVAGTDVYPGAAKRFEVAVSNTSLMGSVNAVRITFPSSGTGVTASAVVAAAPQGWSAPVRATNGASLFFFGGSIPSGGTVTFPINGDVVAPAVDKTGKFAVTLSTDAGATGFGATDVGLTTVVRVLEVVSGPAPSAPAGVVDGTATGGQTITETFTVFNRGSGSLTVTPALSSSAASDAITQAAPASITAGTSRAFATPVVLGAASSADRTSTFTADASATGAQAPRKSSTLAVQQPALISMPSVAPANVRPGISYSFTGTGSKTATPTLSIRSGELSFAGTKAALTSPTSLTHNNAVTFQYGLTTVVGDGTADGNNKSYPVSFLFDVTDSNDHPYRISGTVGNNITLDALAPVLTLVGSLPTDGDGARQTAAKNGDAVSFSGTIDDCTASLNFVRLQPNVGTAITKTDVTPSRNAVGQCSFSGSFPGVTFDPGATSFTLSAQASDAAANTGGAGTPAFTVDNLAPALNYSQTMSSTRILVRFAENHRVLGGCTPSQYKVDGDPLVQRVLYSDGSTCQPRQAGPDNDRILVLTQPKDQDFTTNVEYTPGTRPVADPAKDGAGADAARAIVRTVVGIAPAPPVLVKAMRNAGAEQAYAETLNGVPTYYTRIAGSDLELTFEGGRTGYTARISNLANQTLATVAVEGSPDTIRVPLGTLADGTHSFRLSLLNGSTIESDLVRFDVVLDRVTPKITGATATQSIDGSTPVAVRFSEFIAAGTDFAFDWTVQQTKDGDTATYAVRKVNATDSTTRTLDIQGAVDVAAPVTAVYELVSPTAKRYEDKAGNRVANS